MPITASRILLPLLCLMLAYCCSCGKQNARTNHSAKDSTGIAVSYEAGSAAFDTGNRRAAFDQYRAGIERSRKAGNTISEGIGYYYLGTAYGQTGKYDSLEQLANQALDIFRNEEYRGHFYLLTRLSLLERYELNSDHLQLTNLGLEILKESRDAADTPAIARTLDLLSRANTLLTDQSKAIKYQEEAAALLRRASDKGNLSKILNNLGQSYTEAGRFEDALQAFYEALQHEGNDLRVDGYTYCYMAFAQMALDRPDSAEYYLRHSKHVADQYKDPKIALNIYSAYSDLYAFQERYPEALAMLDSGVNLMQQSGINALMPAFQISRSKAFYNMGRYKEALKADGIADSLFAVMREDELQKKIAELETRYQTREKETSIRTLSRTASVQQGWLLAVATVLMLAIALGVFALVLYRRQKKANKVISDQADRLQWLMKEIHHRVKNNLQVITSLIHMQLRKNDDPYVKDMLTDTVTRIQSIAIIHQKLYQNKEQESVILADYLQQLARAIEAVHGPATIEVHTSIRLDVETAVMLGLLVTELITNSCKHARVEGRQLLIRMTISVTGGGYEMMYEDNGPGLPGQAGDKRSMGMQLIGLMVRQMGGSAQWANRDGLLCTVAFKDERQRKETA